MLLDHSGLNCSDLSHTQTETHSCRLLVEDNLRCNNWSVSDFTRCTRSIAEKPALIRRSRFRTLQTTVVFTGARGIRIIYIFLILLLMEFTCTRKRAVIGLFLVKWTISRGVTILISPPKCCSALTSVKSTILLPSHDPATGYAVYQSSCSEQN